MSEKTKANLSFDAEEFGAPLLPNLRQSLEAELELAKDQTFPEYHPYSEALRRTLEANVITLNCEKIIARHCFHVCAEKIREKGKEGREDPDYQKYISLLRSLPTDWFDENNGQLLDKIELWN